MRATLVRIGNSRGIRIPKGLIEQASLEGELELEVVEGALLVRKARTSREGWAAAAKACRQAGDDDLSEWDAVSGDSGRTW